MPQKGNNGPSNFAIIRQNRNRLHWAPACRPYAGNAPEADFVDDRIRLLVLKLRVGGPWRPSLGDAGDRIPKWFFQKVRE